MFFGIDLTRVRFEQPHYLWLLAGTAVLLAVWFRASGRRVLEARRFTATRTLPVRERFSLLGDLPSWVFFGLGCAFLALALARPIVTTSLLQTAGVDIVVLQDGSSSMRVQDVAGDRWQRSIAFLRVLGESLRWKDDRIAMSVFAHIAAPQVRLTKDPNTYFFFLDHLDQEPPFRLEDDTTWDTNIELGIHWGLRQIERDEELNGRTPSAKVFVLITDGQEWSGEAEKSIQLARTRDVPIMVVGVGTTGGGLIPEAVGMPGTPLEVTRWSPIRSVLDRASLTTIATNGGGRYLEIGRDGDREIASTIIDMTRRRAGTRGVEETTLDLYWFALAAAAICLALGVLFLRERSELWLQLAGSGAALAALLLLTR